MERTPVNNDLLNSPLANLLAKADVVAAPSQTIIYIGFCRPGTTQTSEPLWSICKVESTAAVEPYVQTIKWANGQNMKNLVFDDRDIYDYKFRTF